MGQDGLDFQLLANADEFRRAIARRWPWFIHATPLQNLDSIRAQGLTPHRDKPPPVGVTETFGPDAAKILCLCALGARQQARGTKSGKHVTFAVPSSCLPERVSLDWSCSWEIALGRWAARGSKSFGEFASAVADDVGTIASYDRIPPEELRLRVAGCTEDPASWPALADTINTDAHIISDPLAFLDEPY